MTPQEVRQELNRIRGFQVAMRRNLRDYKAALERTVEHLQGMIRALERPRAKAGRRPSRA